MGLKKTARNRSEKGDKMSTAAAGKVAAWAWEHLGDEISQFLERRYKEWEQRHPPLKEIRKRWMDFNWGYAEQQYRSHVKQYRGQFNVFGLGPTTISDLFADVFILKEQPSSRWPYNSDAGSESKPVSGLRLFAQPEAHRLFVWGEPGAGKTTFLKHILLELLEKKPEKIPVFVSLNEWAASDKPATRQGLLDFLADQFDICGFPDARGFIDYILEVGRAVLLLDGLDEVSKASQSDVIRAIDSFARSKQGEKVQCLLTCRLGGTSYRFDHFTHVRMADWGPRQIRQFVRKRFADEHVRQKFLAALDAPENKKLKDFSKNPLLLSLLCAAFDPEKGFPTRIADIYRDATRHLLAERDVERNVTRDRIYTGLTMSQKEALYAQLAFSSFGESQIIFEQDALERQIARIVQRILGKKTTLEIPADEILEDLVTQHGIITKRGRRAYAFAHLTFQEYYTARYIAENASRGTLPGLMHHLGDPRWNEVFLLTASLLDEADDFFAAMQNALTDMLRGEETLWAMAQHVNRKTAAVRGYHPGAVRAVYWLYNLTFELAISPDPALAFGSDPALDPVHALARAFAPSLDLARAYVFALDLARALALDLALDIAFNCDLDYALARTLALVSRPSSTSQGAEVLFFDLNITYLVQFVEYFAREGKGAIREHRPKLAAYCQALQTRFASMLHPALVAHLDRLPSPDAPEPSWEDFSNRLRALAVAHHDIGHPWELTWEQYRLIGQYLESTQLLLACLLEVNRVRDRKAILERVLAVPETGE